MAACIPHCRGFAILPAVALVAACAGDPSSPSGEESVVTVRSYLEDDGVPGPGAGDSLIAGDTIRIVSNEGAYSDSAVTGADGSVTFNGVPAGGYRLTHTADAGPLTLATTDSALVVVAPFSGDSVVAAFTFAYRPATITGTVFRDEDANGTFEAGVDSTFPGFIVALFAGDDTTANAVAQDTTEDAGTWAFGDVAHGEYTLLVRAPAGATIVGGPTFPITVEPAAEVKLDVQFTGAPARVSNPRNGAVSIARVRLTRGRAGPTIAATLK